MSTSDRTYKMEYATEALYVHLLSRERILSGIPWWPIQYSKDFARARHYNETKGGKEMKNVLMLVFAMVIAATFAASGFAQRSGPDENSAPPERMEKEKPAKEMKTHKKMMKKRHKKTDKEMKMERPAHEPDHRE